MERHNAPHHCVAMNQLIKSGPVDIGGIRNREPQHCGYKPGDRQAHLHSAMTYALRTNRTEQSLATKLDPRAPLRADSVGNCSDWRPAAFDWPRTPPT